MGYGFEWVAGYGAGGYGGTVIPTDTGYGDVDTYGSVGYGDGETPETATTTTILGEVPGSVFSSVTAATASIPGGSVTVDIAPGYGHQFLGGFGAGGYGGSYIAASAGYGDVDTYGSDTFGATAARTAADAPGATATAVAPETATAEIPTPTATPTTTTVVTPGTATAHTTYAAYRAGFGETGFGQTDYGGIAGLTASVTGDQAVSADVTTASPSTATAAVATALAVTATAPHRIATPAEATIAVLDIDVSVATEEAFATALGAGVAGTHTVTGQPTTAAASAASATATGETTITASATTAAASAASATTRRADTATAGVTLATPTTVTASTVRPFTRSVQPTIIQSFTRQGVAAVAPIVETVDPVAQATPADGTITLGTVITATAPRGVTASVPATTSQGVDIAAAAPVVSGAPTAVGLLRATSVTATPTAASATAAPADVTSTGVIQATATAPGAVATQAGAGAGIETGAPTATAQAVAATIGTTADATATTALTSPREALPGVVTILGLPVSPGGVPTVAVATKSHIRTAATTAGATPATAGTDLRAFRIAPAGDSGSSEAGDGTGLRQLGRQPEEGTD